MNKLKIKRVYEKPEAEDGTRFLVERLWPRGIRKEELHITAWLKEIAPSSDLRRWYAHDVNRWNEFQTRYLRELENNPNGYNIIIEALQHGNVTLLFSAHDLQHNSALVLKSFIEEKIHL